MKDFERILIEAMLPRYLRSDAAAVYASVQGYRKKLGEESFEKALRRWELDIFRPIVKALDGDLSCFYACLYETEDNDYILTEDAVKKALRCSGGPRRKPA